MRLSALFCYSVVVAGLGILSGCVAQVAGDDPKDTAASKLSPEQTCTQFNGYTGALAHALLVCDGTIGPKSFYTNDRGHLRRAFDKCSLPFEPDENHREDTRLQTIDDILGIQSRNDLAGECIPKQWVSWRERFLEAGNSMCPLFDRAVEKFENDPSFENVKMNASGLPPLSRREGEGLPDEKAPDVTPGDEHAFYLVHFDKEPSQPCGSAETCAKECSEGLPGAFVRQDGDYVVMDPLWWLTDYLYPDPSTNPFMSYDYYHPMSFEGDLPGDLYGHINRTGELCSLYMGGDHYLGILDPHCLVEKDLRSCMSLCTYY